MKILVIQTAFLGDAILGTAAIETIKANFPEAEVHYLVRQGNEGILKNNPHLTKLHVWEKKQHKWKSALQLIGLFRSIGFDYVINLQRFFTSGLIAYSSGGLTKACFQKSPWAKLFNVATLHDTESGIHELERNHQLLQATFQSLRKGINFHGPKLYPSEADFQQIASLTQTGSYYVIAPASVWFTKQWPATKWAELINSLPQDKKVFLTGAPNEVNFINNIIELVNIGGSKPAQGVISLAGKLSLLEVAALISKAERTFCSDSAPLHIATAMEAPVTAVFCSTVPKFGFGPYWKNGEVVEITKALNCRPCGLHGKRACPLNHFRCAEDISISQVLATLS